LAYIGIAVFLATILFVVYFAPGKHTESNPVSLQTAAPSEPAEVSLGIETSSSVSPEPEAPVAAPFIYEKDEDIFMASGKNKVKLGSRQSFYGCYKVMNCVLSDDNRYLYYIEDTDITTGMGTLKKTSTDAASSPVTIESGVCAAEVSSAGSIMYIKNIKGIAGDLYLLKNGKSSLIDKNVLPVFMKFSQDGNCISYIVKEGGQTFALYIKKGNEKPVMAVPITAEATINDGINLSRIIDTVPFDSGQILYSIKENYNMPLYFFNLDGKTERICNDGYIIKTYPDGDFLYADIAKNNLWYKSPGADAVNITENYSYSIFPVDSNRFLLLEHIGDGIENSRVMMYEIGEDKKKTTISLGDDKIFEINAAFDCVAYECGGVLYASRKTNTGWKETNLLKVSEDKIRAGSPKSGIVARYDLQGENLYFYDEYTCGPLYRFSLKEEKTVKLLNNVDHLYVHERAVYAVERNKLYSIGGSETEMISGGVRSVKETRGGAFLFADGSFKFIPEDLQSEKLLDSFTAAAEITGSIECRAPLVEDLSAALEVLSDEANYCLYKLGVYRVKVVESININDALTIAQKLAEREDINGTERKILGYMIDGFRAYKEKKRKVAAASLKNAMEAYEEYINSSGNER
jgi:hypothetical protein